MTCPECGFSPSKPESVVVSVPVGTPRKDIGRWMAEELRRYVRDGGHKPF